MHCIATFPGKVKCSRVLPITVNHLSARWTLAPSLLSLNKFQGDSINFIWPLCIQCVHSWYMSYYNGTNATQLSIWVFSHPLLSMLTCYHTVICMHQCSNGRNVRRHAIFWIVLINKSAEQKQQWDDPTNKCCLYIQSLILLIPLYHRARKKY